MKLFWTLLPVGLLMVVAVILARQWQARVGLENELVKLRAQQTELAELRLENQRLLAAQVSPAELENLRADHATIVRLREQWDALNARARSGSGPASQ